MRKGAVGAGGKGLLVGLLGRSQEAGIAECVVRKPKAQRPAGFQVCQDAVYA